MDRNLLLAFALSMAVFSAWLAWQQVVVVPQRKAMLEQQRGEQAAAGAEEAATEAGDETGAGGPSQSGPATAPAAETPSAPLAAAAADQASARPGDTGAVELWEGEFVGSAATARFSNRGATLVSWRLANYFETPRNEVHVDLIDLPPGAPGTFSTPFDELGFGDLTNAVYEVEHSDDERVTFVLRRSGVEIRKTFTRPSDDFTTSLRIDVSNRSDGEIAPRFAVVLPVATNAREDFRDVALIALVDGDVTHELVPSIGASGFFSRLFGGGNDGPISFDSQLAFAGFDMRYFSGVILPESRAEAGVTLLPVEVGRSAKAVVSVAPPVAIASGEDATRMFSAFLGPKRPAILASLGDDIAYAISRAGSWIAPLTNFFSWALHRVHDFVPNYGLAIILLTLLVRLATWPIMVKQMKSAERMRELMPRIKELQEKFKDDRQRQSEETFKLYRETGVNPLGGCLPMLLQLPVFIGLFYALQSSIDLRHAPFFLWIDDLSAPEKLFTLPGVDFPVRLLPLLMGASMYIQQRMTPQAGMDPVQAKMMLILMPGMMLVISYTFPSGLVLYWTVSNVLGIAHQLYVRRQMNKAEA